MQANNPQFATVTFISGDDTPGNTFRVPITYETTVRQLAKEAMQRLVLSRRSAGHRLIPSIMVTEVFVGGEANRPKAEVFSQDLVTQVVLVKEEVIYMRLQSSGESSAQHPLPPPAAVAAPAVAPAAATSAPKAASAQPERPARIPQKSEAAVVEAPRPSVAKPRVASTKSAAPKTTKTTTATVPAKRGRSEDLPEEDSTIRRLRAAEEAKRLRWGPEASTSFAANYVSSPNRLMSRRKPAPDASGKASTAASSTTAAPLAKRPRTDAPAQREVASVPVVATETRDAEGFTREGWGPDAYKNFAANYVTSPDRLARLIRQQRRAQKAATTKPASANPSSDTRTAANRKPATTTAVAPKRVVSRQLAFPETDDGPESRQTVGHGVTLIEVEDDSPATPPPKGWGTEASKYFDTKTYCDDPSKARLTKEELSRPMQTRHSCRS